jgi:2-dehydro-3-deoxygluconokinase
MRKHNVGTKHILSGGNRLGLYFLENGVGCREGSVIYDRTNSAFSEIKPGMISWKEVFKDASWFHWSGISPAVSQSAAETCLEAVKIANEMGINISTDLNYRAKLWKYDKEPKEVMPELLKYSNLILGDLDTAFFLFGKDPVAPDYQNLKSLPELHKRFFDLCPNLKQMATTLRYSINASHQKIGGVLYDRETIYSTDIKDVASVVDRVGSGDAFMGGMLYGFINTPKDKKRILNLAVAACCLKHTVSGDVNLITLEELEKMASGNAFGKVNR